MNELHLFAGAGGGILGGILCGHTTVCAVEIEPYCRKVLLQRQRDGILPKFPIWDDVCTFDGTAWRGKVDVVCGGFPCQDISSAGKRIGIEGKRSGLWKEMSRIISEVQPRYVFIENSPLLKTRGLDVVLGDLAKLGYDAKWGIISAENIGALHKRKRIWILGYSNKGRLQGSLARSKIWSKEEEFQSVECRKEISLSQPAGIGRTNDVAYCVDRIKAIGNGQVPAVAAKAWRILTQKT
jgi:DNA (cytosine-5)-methyltransferase 1